MKTFPLIVMLAGFMGCASTPAKKPLRPQPEAPPPQTRVDDEATNCDFNLTMCVRPAPKPPPH